MRTDKSQNPLGRFVAQGAFSLPERRQKASVSSPWSLIAGALPNPSAKREKAVAGLRGGCMLLGWAPLSLVRERLIDVCVEGGVLT